MTHSNPWRNDVPSLAEVVKYGAETIRKGRLKFSERFGVDHIIESSLEEGADQDGIHKQLTMKAQDPNLISAFGGTEENPSDAMVMFTAMAGEGTSIERAELHAMNSYGVARQITRCGYLKNMYHNVARRFNRGEDDDPDAINFLGYWYVNGNPVVQDFHLVPVNLIRTPLVAITNSSSVFMPIETAPYLLSSSYYRVGVEEDGLYCIIVSVGETYGIGDTVSFNGIYWTLAKNGLKWFVAPEGGAFEYFEKMGLHGTCDGEEFYEWKNIVSVAGEGGAVTSEKYLDPTFVLFKRLYSGDYVHPMFDTGFSVGSVLVYDGYTWRWAHRKVYLNIIRMGD